MELQGGGVRKTYKTHKKSSTADCVKNAQKHLPYLNGMTYVSKIYDGLQPKTLVSKKLYRGRGEGVKCPLYVKQLPAVTPVKNGFLGLRSKYMHP